eukprot:TRINITY_DN19237_c0_g1_i1.p1 TRINITY_DN19237_c0_g1~~TRINITY_DN19237_c0_g1_i1.p1  ORF type:complete len:1383 (+),score=462.19 TRINITY_DN19237_c0_g1_i1:51-4151(+)
MSAMNNNDLKTKLAAAAGMAAVGAAISKMYDNHIINRPMASIEVAIETFRNGRPLIVMDDEDRENEGDIIVPAQDLTEEMVAMMVNETTGILCAPMTEDRANELGLDPMLVVNTDSKGTAFTVTTDLKPLVPLDSGLIPDICDKEGNSGLTTGVSAYDRMITFHALAHPKARGSDFGRPGHIFPLRAKRGGISDRRGHTEASVDLCRLANKFPVGSIGELVNKDGSMKRLDDCKRLGWRLNIPCITIDALSNYLYKKPLRFLTPSSGVVRVAECTIPITRNGKFHGTWNMVCFKEHVTQNEHIIMTVGDVAASKEPVPVRIHSECFTGDLMGSMRCDCGDQLDQAFSHISDKGVGVVIYMTGHEGRGIGLVNKMHAYQLQAKGFDTYRANRELGFQEDLRNFDACADIILALGVKSTVQLLTNSPLKEKALSALKGKLKVETVPLLCEHNKFNTRYLTDKRNHETRLREGGLGSTVSGVKSSLQLSDRSHVALMPKLRIAIVKTVWFGVPLHSLQKQIVSELLEAGVVEENISEVIVPGANNLPFAAQAIAATGKVDAILCLGITIKGGHVPQAFTCMSSAVANGLNLVQIEHNTPVLFGVLACEHKQMAIDRCSQGGELAYSLALSTLQVACQSHTVSPPKGGVMPCFPPKESTLPSSPLANAMTQSCAANETQAQELSSKVYLPSKEVAKDLKVSIIATTWNQGVVDYIVNELTKSLGDFYVKEENITVIRVPGSFEIPYAASQAAAGGADVVVTCSVLIKGNTAHFEYVALSEALGIVESQLRHSCPILSGMLLCVNDEHLAARAKEIPVPLALSVLHQAALAKELGVSKPAYKPLVFGVPPAVDASPVIKDMDFPKTLKLPSKEEAKAIRVGIVRTAWNESMVEQMRDGVAEVLKSNNIESANIVEKVVPGSFELPSGAQLMAESEGVDVVLCMGILIKGDTKHFEYICQAASHGILKAQEKTGVPMLFGVLTCFSVEQAREGACKGSVLHESLGMSAIHMAMLHRYTSDKKTSIKKLEAVETREIPPSELRSALAGELVKDIPRTLKAPSVTEAKNMSIGIVATSDEEIQLVDQMVEGITSVFKAAGLTEANIITQYVPTSFDLPHAASKVIEESNVMSVIAVGVLIEDTTARFDTACEASSFGLQEVGIKHSVPTLFGVLTCHTVEQARERAEKGSELHYSLAMSALHMACMRRGLGTRKGKVVKGKLLKVGEVTTAEAKSLKVCLVRTSWNENQVLAVLEELRGALLDAGVKINNITEEVVPGTYELPYTAAQISKTTNMDVICLLGTMVQGDVSNFEYMAAATVRGFTLVGMKQSTPLVWGVKCVRTHEELLQSTPNEVQQLASRILHAALLKQRLVA